MRWLSVGLIAVALLAGDPRIVWDESTRVLIQRGGGYGRMVRLQSGEILCSYEWGGKVWVRRSTDEGKTWSEADQAVAYAFGTAANPEMLVLRDGSVMLFYNERPRDGVHPFTIQATRSSDGGRTWSEPRLLYEAGTTNGTGCWEPAAVQLASGEIQLFFANELPYPDTNEQEITMLRSLDDGSTWGGPETASFRPKFRDGMPVPLAMGDRVILAIEDNGMAGRFKPVIVPVGDSASRWPALATQLPDEIYAGAPYIRQFPSGETVLSIQSTEGRDRTDTHTFSRMVVYIGDSEARNFTSKSVPFDVPPEANGLWNALFIKNERTVTAISGTVVDGLRGLWAIDGYLEYRTEQ